MRCERCGCRVVDNTTDFGNGLMMRTTPHGVEFCVRQSDTSPYDWTPGISVNELLVFLGVSPERPT